MAQLLKKFIGDNQVADEKIRLDNNSFLRSRNAANSADVDMLKVSAADEIMVGGALNMNSNNIDDASGLFFDGDNTRNIGTTGGRAAELYVRKINGDSAKLELSGSPIEVQNEVVPATNASQDIGSALLNFASVFTNEVRSDSGTLTLTGTVVEADGNFIPTTNYNKTLGDGTNNWQAVFAGGMQQDDATDNLELGANTEVIELWSYNGTVAPSLQLNNAAGTQYLRIKAPNALTTTYTLTMPDNDGNSGQFLQTDGSGVLTWATPAGAELTNKATFTLSAGDITNQYIDLSHVAKTNSIVFFVRGGGVQQEGASYDYSVNYTGGAGGNTRITFLNDLATGGPSALVAGDIVVIQYEY